MAKADDRMIERTVQEIAQKYLENFYQKRSKPVKMYSQIEERTKKIHGMKRADGFLAYPSWFGRLYTVSMEAKSHKTLAALKPYRVTKLWLLDAIWIGFLATMLSGTLFLIFSPNYHIALRLLLPFGIWAIAAALWAFFRKDSYKYQEMAVIHQVFQYPANERWISFSYDALEMIDHKLRDNLFRICAGRGIGVLLVNANKDVHLVSKPKYNFKWRGDFVSYYLNEPEIRAVLKKGEPASKGRTVNKIKK